MRSRLLLLAATSVLTVWLTYRSLVTSTTGQRLDQLAMLESMAAAPAQTSHLRHVLHVVSVPSIAVSIAVLAAVALRRSRPELGAAAAATIVGANLTAQVLKGRLDRPDLLGLGQHNSFPSGHVTVVASLAAGALLVSSKRARPAVAVVGAAAAAVTAVAAVTHGWHRPSDVVGAVGVVAAWGATAAAWAVSRSPGTCPAARRVAVQSVA